MWLVSIGIVLDTPKRQGLDYGAQGQSCRSKPIFRPGRHGRNDSLLHNPFILEQVHALLKCCGIHTGWAAAQLVEAERLVKKRCDDKDHPFFLDKVLAGKIIIDTINYFAIRDGAVPEIDDGSTTSGELIAKLHPGRHCPRLDAAT